MPKGLVRLTPPLDGSIDPPAKLHDVAMYALLPFSFYPFFFLRALFLFSVSFLVSTLLTSAICGRKGLRGSYFLDFASRKEAGELEGMKRVFGAFSSSLGKIGRFYYQVVCLKIKDDRLSVVGGQKLVSVKF